MSHPWSLPLLLAQRRKPHNPLCQVILSGKGQNIHAGATEDHIQVVHSPASTISKSLPEPAVARVDIKLLASLGILQNHGANVGQFHLTRVAQPNRQDLVTLSEKAKWLLPTRRADEIGDDENERPTTKHANRGFQQRPQVSGGR